MTAAFVFEFVGDKTKDIYLRYAEKLRHAIS